MTRSEVDRFDKLINEAISLLPEDRFKGPLAQVKYDLKRYLFEQDRMNESGKESGVPVLPVRLAQ